MIKMIMRLLRVWSRPKVVDPQAVGWSMQYRELPCGCKTLVMANGKKLWIVGLTNTGYGSHYERCLS